MTIHIGADHAGFALKQVLVPFLQEHGYEVVDAGAHEHDPDDDYPDFVAPVAQAVSEGDASVRGIVLGGSGQGEAMLANRFKNVRAAVYYGGAHDIITLSRIHNDANVLALGARFITDEEAQEAVKLWLATEHPENERYDRRIQDAEARSAT